MPALGYWNDVVDRGRKRMGGGQGFVYRFSADSAQVLRGEDYFLVGLELSASRAISVWSVHGNTWGTMKPHRLRQWGWVNRGTSSGYNKAPTRLRDGGHAKGYERQLYPDSHATTIPQNNLLLSVEIKVGEGLSVQMPNAVDGVIHLVGDGLEALEPIADDVAT